MNESASEYKKRCADVFQSIAIADEQVMNTRGGITGEDGRMYADIYNRIAIKARVVLRAAEEFANREAGQ